MVRTSLLLTAFCVLFSMVYEHFSHGVYSPFMICLFLVPLLGGVVPSLVLVFSPGLCFPSPFARSTYRLGLITLAVGSCLRGVFEIYGTSAPLVGVYGAAGGVLTATGIVSYLFHGRRPRIS